MGVFLDGKAIEGLARPTCTLGDLVQHIGNLPGYGDRIVQMITVNGLEIDDWEVNSSFEFSQDAEVHVMTQSVGELIASTLQSANEYLPRLDSSSVQAAILLHEGRERDAFGLVAQLVEGLQWYAEFLASVTTLMPNEAEWASERLAALGNVLENVLGSWEVRDYTLLADLLEYELSPELKRGCGYLEELARPGAVDTGDEAC